jgi:hypothetical protein
VSRKKATPTAKRGRGRPLELTPELIQQLATSIRATSSKEAAVSLAGIDLKTLRNWMRRGRKERDGLYRNLFLAIRKALAEFESFHAANIASVARGKPGRNVKTERVLPDGTKETVIEKEPTQFPQWTASAWLLERRNPRWQRKDTVRHEGGDPGRPVVFEMAFDRPLARADAVHDDEHEGEHEDNGGNGNGNGNGRR